MVRFSEIYDPFAQVGGTALHDAIENGSVELVRLLLDKGAGINVQRKV